MAFAGPYQRTDVSEVIPDSVSLKGLRKSSIITARRRARIIPQTGTLYSPTGTTLCNIMIQDAAGLLDLQSCVLSFSLQTETTALPNGPNNVGIPDDFAWSILQRLQISLNSVLLDDIDYVGRRATMEVYASASRSWYSSIGSFMGAWKFCDGTSALSTVDGSHLRGAGSNIATSQVLTAGNAAANFAITGTAAGVITLPNTPVGASVPHNDVVDKLTAANIWFKNISLVAGNWTAAPSGNVFSIPMSMLSHFFRMEQYFPIRNAGQLMIQLLFAQPQACLFSYGANTGPTYQVSDLCLEADFLTVHPEYSALLDSIAARSQSEGLALAFDSHLVSQQTPGLGSSVTVVSSKASQNVRSLHFTMQPLASINSQGYLQNSCFSSNGIAQYQIRVGSNYYPAFPSQGLSRNFMELIGSFNSQSASVGQDCIIDYDNYRGNVSAAGVDVNPSLYSHAACYIGGYCFDSLKHSEILTHDGINTLSQSGSQIALQLDFTGNNNAGAVTTYIRFTRVVIFADSGVRVEG